MPNANWYNDRLKVDRYNPDHANDDLGVREVVSGNAAPNIGAAYFS